MLRSGAVGPSRKELVLTGVYVADAIEAEERYRAVGLRRIAIHRTETERGFAQCVVLASGTRRPWVGVFSGEGRESVAAQMLSERPPGLHHLVYFTDTYDDDLAWLRRRGLGFEGVVVLDGRRVLRRVSSTIAELGMVVDLVERPPPELEEDWLRPLIDALVRPQRLEPAVVRPPARAWVSDGSTASFAGPGRGAGVASELVLPAGESLAAWQARLHAHTFSARCSARPDGVLVPELSALLERIHTRGAAGYQADVEAASRELVGHGLGARFGTTSGGPHRFAPSPIFLSRADAAAFRDAARQRALAWKALLADLYAGRPTPIPPATLASSPFASLRAAWAPPTPSGLVQYLAVVARDGATGAATILQDGADSGRAGFASAAPLRHATLRAHGAALAALGATDAIDPVPLLRACLGPAGTKIAMVYEREPPPFDLPDWEDRLLADALAVPLIAESDLRIDDDGCVMPDGTRLEVVLHRRSSGSPGLTILQRLARAGKLRLVDPVSATLLADRALQARAPELVTHYTGEAPRLASLASASFDQDGVRARVLADPARFLLRQRGGAAGRRVVEGAALTAADGPLPELDADPGAWVAEDTFTTSTYLFFAPTDGGVLVHEAEVRFYVYVLVGADASSSDVFGARVSRAGETIAADVVVVS